jgi:hypothetical protein
MQAVPRVETQRSTQVSDVSDQSGNSDLLINNLVYTQPKALSLAVNRTYNRQFFQRNTYAGDRSSTAICDWNSGTSYVNSHNSYVTFKVKVLGTGTPTATWGTGSAMNVVNEIRIRSRSGTELDRLQNANIYSKYESVYTKPRDNLATVGSSQGFPSVVGTPSTVAQINSVTATRFTIPLPQLSTFFKPLKGQLLPPQLASGLHIEIVFEDYRTALKQLAGVVTGYEITDIEFQLDSVDMTDDVQKTINMESAEGGLEYAYERVYTSVSQQSVGQLTMSKQVRKAVSQACYATSVCIDSALKIDKTADSLVSRPYDITSFQYRLGALYFPHQKIQDSGEDGVEAFTNAMMVYDKLQNPYSSGSVDVSTFKSKFAIMSASFEKDTHLNMSGLPINNSRVLELNCEFSGAAAAFEVYTFLTFCSVARVFLDNIAVAL